MGLQVFTYMFVHVWRLQGIGGCLPNLLALLVFWEQGLLLSLNLISLARMAGQ